jgi:hypothetical protein
VGDFYTRLYWPPTLSLRGQPLFDALNQLSDVANLRWNKDGDWLQFRSASYFHDRAKEVPNRLLSGWRASRQKNGHLTLEDLVEIARLSDAQLDAAAMADGAIQCWGLREWILPRSGALRRDLRFLAELSPAQREEATSATGLAFTKLSLAQQQRFIEIGMRFDDRPLLTLNELEGAVIRVEYTQPGSFVWIPPGNNWFRWVVPIVPGPEGRRAVLPTSRGRTPEEARAAARRLDARLLEAILPEVRRSRPEVKSTAMVVDAGEVAPTQLDLTVVFVPGLSNRHTIHISSLTADYHNSTW